MLRSRSWQKNADFGEAKEKEEVQSPRSAQSSPKAFKARIRKFGSVPLTLYLSLAGARLEGMLRARARHAALRYPAAHHTFNSPRDAACYFA